MPNANSQTREPTDAELSALDFVDSSGKASLPPQAPGAFAGFGKAIGYGLMRGSASARRGLAMAAPAAMEVFGTGLTDEGNDWWQKNVVQPNTDAIHQWTPRANDVGKAGQIVGGLVDSLTPFVAGPEVGLLSTGMNAGANATDQGVDAKTATAVAATQTAAAAVGFKIPVLGSTLTTRIASGAVGNVVAMEAGRQATQVELNAGGYGTVADQYKGNTESRAIDALMGSVFGVSAHLGAPKGAQDVTVQDATLTAANALHYVNETMPGEPLTPDASAHHQDLLGQAIRELNEGKPVNVEGKFDPSKFSMPPAPRAVPEFANYDAMRVALESGGNPNAKPSTSGALGLDQFIPSTWRRVVEIAKPAWAEGLTDRQLLDARRDPVKSSEMERVLRAENAAMLEKAGQPVTPLNLYAAHHFGANAIEFARASGDTPMSDILSAKQIKANPYLDGLTKDQAIANWTRRARRAGVNVEGATLVDTNPAGQALRQRFVENPERVTQEYAALEESKGGTILNTDTARELSPEYNADRTRSADVHEAASDIIKQIYADKLAAPTPEGFDPIVRFTAGGTGAGKTTAVKAMGDAAGRPEITYDTNMNKLESSVDKIEQALAASRNVQIAYTYRDPVEALRMGALPRAMRQEAKFGSGRTVPLSEHIATHVGSAQTIRELAQRYAGDSRVDFRFVDNSRGRGNHRAVPLEKLQKVDENGLHERLRETLDEAHATGEISDAVYRGFLAESSRHPGLGEGFGRQSQQERLGGTPGRSGSASSGDSSFQDGSRVDGNLDARNPETGAGRQGEVTTHADAIVAAAHEVLALDPSLHVIDDFGQMRSAAELLAEAHAEQAKAHETARGIGAVGACFLRTAA